MHGKLVQVCIKQGEDTVRSGLLFGSHRAVNGPNLRNLNATKVLVK